MVLLPMPKHMEEKEGTFLPAMDAMIVPDISCPQGAWVYARQLREEIAVWAGLQLEIGRGTFRAGDILMRTDALLGKNRYSLKIAREGAFLCGGSLEALGWAAQTLRQIVRQCAGLWPLLEIEDEPDMEIRGFYHDISRGRIPTMAGLKQMADRLAFYKLNQFQLYVEHTYLFRDLTELWRDETPLTAEEIVELDQYCYDRGIELVPSLATFGRLYKLLSSKSFGKLCELPEMTSPIFSYISRMDHHTVDVSNPDALVLVKRMIGEYMALFRSDKFNLCADETFDLGKGKSAALAREKGIGRLYMDYLGELFDFLIERGKTPMFWGDIICKYPELYRQIPEGVICLNWGYSDTQPDTQIRALHEAGVVQYICPGVSGWNNWINDLQRSYGNITRMCGYARKYQASGILNTDWGDYGHINAPVFSIPGLIYGAVCSWGTNIPEYEELNRQISVLEFGDASGELAGFLGEAARQKVFGWDCAVIIKEWTQARMERERILSVLARRDMAEVREANARIGEMEERLRVISRSLDSRNRGLAAYVQVSLEAIRLWNETGLFLERLQKGEQPEGGGALAERLERCLCHFRKLWRQDSREGDIMRITEVFCWYADLLRTSVWEL